MHWLKCVENEDIDIGSGYGYITHLAFRTTCATCCVSKLSATTGTKNVKCAPLCNVYYERISV